MPPYFHRFFVALKSCLIAVSFSVSHSLAQSDHPVFQQYTIDDGLPSNEVYDIHQDGNGFMWFATDAGVVQYDSRSFTTYDKKDGLPDDIVIQILEDSYGRMWFCPVSGQLAYFEQGKINSLSLPEADADNGIQFIYLDTNDVLWYAPNLINNKFYKIHRDLSIDSEVRLNLPVERVWENFAKVKRRFLGIPHLTEFVPKDIDTNSNHPYVFFEKYLKGGAKYWSRINDAQCLITSNTHDSYVNISGVEFNRLIYNNHVILADNGQQWNLMVNAVRINDFNKLKIIVHQPRNVYYKYEVFKPFDYLFDTLSYRSEILQDFEGGVWVTTLDNGVFYHPNMFVNRIDKDSALFATAKKNRKYYGSRQFDKNTLRNWKKTRTSTVYFDLYDAIDDTVYVAHGYGWDITMNGDTLSTSSASNFHRQVKAIAVDHSGTVWLGTTTGLYRYANNQYYDEGIHNELLRSRIIDIEVFPDQRICIATEDVGVLILEGDNVTQYSKETGLSSNRCTHLFIENDTLFYVATTNGLNRVSRLKEGIVIKHLTINEGLPGRKVSFIDELGNELIIKTNKGWCRIDRERVWSVKAAPKASINGITINNRDTIMIPNLKLKYADRDIAFQFVGLSYRSKTDIDLICTLEGKEIKKYTRKQGVISFSELDPGNYTFKVASADAEGAKNNELASCEFEIQTPFWLRHWFIFSCVLIIVLIVYLAFRLRIAQLKRQARINDEINLLKQKALRAQINPHFLFNTLNSIQDYILRQDIIASNEYLTNFASLMRQVLYNSEHDLIPVEKEIEALSKYIELEKMRFENQFDYSINLDDSIDEYDDQIPPLIMQPYVENAIIHGVSELTDRRGRIDINISKQGETMLIKIEDNGVGYSPDNKETPTEYRSMGSAITKQRIELLNQLGQKRNLKIETINKQAPEYEESGTIVSFEISLN